MNNLFLISLLIVSLFSYPIWSETMDDLVVREKIYYKKFTSKPFTGNIDEELTKGSFKNYYPKISINEKSCILKKDSPGVYCLRIDAENNKKFNYIGISGVSIHDRLLHHFIKIAGTTEYAGGRHSSDTKEFKLMREYFNSKKIDTSNPNFFNSVQLSFSIFKKSTKLEAKLLKIEGMGIQSFKNKHGHIPELNSRDETFGIEHFPIND